MRAFRRILTTTKTCSLIVGVGKITDPSRHKITNNSIGGNSNPPGKRTNDTIETCSFIQLALPFRCQVARRPFYHVWTRTHGRKVQRPTGLISWSRLKDWAEILDPFPIRGRYSQTFDRILMTTLPTRWTFPAAQTRTPIPLIATMDWQGMTSLSVVVNKPSAMKVMWGSELSFPALFQNIWIYPLASIELNSLLKLWD